MSVEKYIGTVQGGAVAQYIPRLREAVQLLVQHAPVTVDSTVTDTDDEYTVILRIGGGWFAKLSVMVGEESHGPVEFSIGYKQGSSFVALNSKTYTVNGAPTAYMTEINMINRGDLWEMSFPVSWYTWATSGTALCILRGSKIVSSIDGAEYLSCGLGSQGVNNQNEIAAAGYPFADYLLFRYEDYEPQEYLLSCSDPDTAHNNVGEGKLMLFPSLLCAPGPFQTGAAMIGNQSTYFMSCRPTDPIPRYEEFVLNRQRFVSLGRLAIRSR